MRPDRTGICAAASSKILAWTHGRRTSLDASRLSLVPCLGAAHPSLKYNIYLMLGCNVAAMERLAHDEHFNFAL
jgi:hypothetical protein